MIPIIMGVIFLLALVAFIYYLKSKPVVILKQDPRPEDIVLAKITSSDPALMKDTYAILWNGTPGNNYHYTITDVSSVPKIIAQGDVICPQNALVKIKDIDLKKGINYQIHVAETSIDVLFEPPEFILPLKLTNKLEGDTNIPPTKIEILSSGEQISLDKCQIKIDPGNPGFICDQDVKGEVTCMVYNGPNAVNIYVGKV